MIGQMRSGKTVSSWRAGLVALGVISCVLPGIGVVSDRILAQTTRPPQGTIVVRVPRGLLPSQNYWLYVNGEIVSAPPHGTFPSLSGEFLHVGPSPEAGPADVYFDASGQAATSEKGRFTYLRPGLRERIFESQPPIQKAAGKAVVELLTQALNQSFPFVAARIEVQVAAGKVEEVEFGIPPGTDEVRIIHASNCTPCSTFFASPSPEDTLAAIQSTFDRTVEGFDKLPIVAVLDEVLLSLPVAPASQPRVSVRLPASMGGSRDLDARQIGLILEGLNIDYRFPTIDGNARLQGAKPPTPTLAEVLALKIARHNAHLDRFGQIVKALEQARR